MSPLFPLAVLRGDRHTIHPFWIQRALGKGPGTMQPPSTSTSSTTPLFPGPFVRVAKQVDSWWNTLLFVAQTHRLPPEWLQAIVHQESGGDPNAYRIEPRLRDISCGLMQVLMGTARGTGYQGSLPDLFDPLTNVGVGAIYLSALLKHFGTFEIALIAYNAGPGAAAVRKRFGIPVPGLGYARTVDALCVLYGLWNRHASKFFPPPHS